MRLVVACVALGFAASVCSGQPLEPEVLRLAKIKLRMAENLERLPNYTCLQTIERTQRGPKSQRTRIIDTIRIEVALVGGKELFAWPGGERFEEREIREFAGPGGAIGNGSFALHARAVFLSAAPVFRYAGESELRGRRAYRYDFSVAQGLSGYLIRSGERTGIAGYHGAVWADAASLDLLRLEVHADDIPPHLEILGASNVIDYERVPLGATDFLLPVTSHLSMLSIYGVESRNAIRLSGCRHYAGESVVTFGDPPPGETPAAPRRQRLELPPGLELEISLETPVKSGQSAIGDPLKATLARDLKHKGKLLAPKGAALTGRLTRLERRYGRRDFFLLGFEFSKLEFGTVEAGVSARFERSASLLPAMAGSPGFTPAHALQPSRSADRSDLLVLPGTAFELPRGFRMIWRTVDPPPLDGIR